MFPIPIDSSAICQTILFIHLNSKQRRVLRKSETIKTPFLYFAYHIECSQHTMKKKSWRNDESGEYGQLEKNLRRKDSNFNLLT